MKRKRTWVTMEVGELDGDRVVLSRRVRPRKHARRVASLVGGCLFRDGRRTWAVVTRLIKKVGAA